MFSLSPRGRGRGEGESLRPDIRLNPGAAIAALLADPAVVLMDLGMLRIQLVAVKIMPVADPTVASQVLRARICFGYPAAFPPGIFDGYPPLSSQSILLLPGYTAGPGRAAPTNSASFVHSERTFVHYHDSNILSIIFDLPNLPNTKESINQTYSSEISPGPSLPNPAKRGTPFGKGRGGGI